MRQVFQNPWVRAAGLLLAIVGVAILCYLLSQVLIPLFFAMLVAYIFDPVADWFERRQRSRMFAIVVIVLSLVCISLLAPVFLLPSIILQAEEFVEIAQATDETLFDQLLDYLPLRELAIEMEWIDESDEDVNERAIVAQKIGNIVRETAQKTFQQHSRELIGAGQQATATAAVWVSTIATTLMNGVLFIGNFALFAFVAIYLLNDYDHIIKTCREMVPPRFRRTVFRITTQIDVQLKGWLRGQVLVCFFLGTCYAIGFSLSGVPFAIPLAIFGGIACFVPFLGIALTIGPATLLCLIEYGLSWQVFGAIGTLLIAQALEGNVITPRIMGSSVGLSPVWVILAIVVFGSTMGFVGLLFAVPIAAVLKVLTVELYEWYIRSNWYNGRPELEAVTPSDRAPED